MVNNILITGCAGFIGFSITKSLLEKKAREFFSVRTNNEMYNYSGVIEDRYWYLKSLKQDDTSPRAFAGGKRTTRFYEF